MRLTAFILLSACMAASAKGLTQTVTLSLKSSSLVQAFSEIEKQTGYSFVYGKEQLAGARAVTIDVKNEKLETVLALLFKDQPLTFTITGKYISIKEKRAPESAVILSGVEGQAPPPIDIHGRIVNEAGEPVLATIQVKGTNKGTTTNSDGYFELKNVEDNATLVISATNIETREIKLNGKNDLDVVNVKMKVTSLNEVVINKGYYSTSQKLNTGAVTKVTSSDIEKQPINNPLLALEGRVPGMEVTQSTGLPGTGTTVQIRGKNSITNGTDPLYVVDGVPVTSQLLPSPVNTLLGGGGFNNGSPFNYLNPFDIESIEVLKDADATAIYGSRGANGVVLITTKKGKASNPVLDVNIQSGFGQVDRTLHLLNTQQYLQMRHEAFSNDNKTPRATDYDINGVWDTTRNADWQKELIGGKARYSDIQASFSDGNKNLRFLISGNYHRETTVFPGSALDQKGSLHFSVTDVSLNKKFNVQFSGSYLIDKNQLPSMDLTQTALSLAPDAPPLYNVDGTLNWAPISPGAKGTWTNPLSYLNNEFNRHIGNLITNFSAGYSILPGLDIKASLGYSNMQIDETRTTPITFWDPYYWNLGNTLRSADYDNGNMNSWIIEPQATYTRKIAFGTFDALVGTTIQQSNSNSQSFSGTGYTNDVTLNSITSAPSLSATGNILTSYKYNALFARGSYNILDKYLINITGRRDGSSRFGPQSQFHNFGSIGVGWIFSSENFIQKHLSFITHGKLRGSYGSSGNDQIGDYNFMNLYQPINSGVPYQSATGLAPNGLTNPYIQWEETKKLDVALEIGLIRNRISFTIDHYQNRSSNQLVFIPLPSITGYNGINGNLPAIIENNGEEIVLNGYVFQSKVFGWRSSVNLTFPHNKLVSFPDFINSTYTNSYIIGEPITILRLYHVLGVNPNTGIYQFSDANGSPTNVLNPKTDNISMFDPTPKFYGGFENSFSFNGFELDFLFQFIKQTGKEYLFSTLPGYFNFNQPTDILNRWQKMGDVTRFQKFTTVTSNGVYNNYRTALNSSDLIYGDASFVRLKNLVISYTLPETWRKKLVLKNVRLGLEGQNLLTITKYRGLDPENQNAASLPPLRVVTFGLHITL